MAQQKRLQKKMSVSIPQTKLDQKPVERLVNPGKKRDRSVNHLVVQAILEYLARSGKEGQ